MDEIFIVVTGKTSSNVIIAKRCSEKNCLAYHHYTSVDDIEIANQVVREMNESSFARTVSARLSA